MNARTPYPSANPIDRPIATKIDADSGDIRSSSRVLAGERVEGRRGPWVTFSIRPRVGIRPTPRALTPQTWIGAMRVEARSDGKSSYEVGWLFAGRIFTAEIAPSFDNAPVLKQLEVHLHLEPITSTSS
jgi:hypothetical protein